MKKMNCLIFLSVLFVGLCNCTSNKKDTNAQKTITETENVIYLNDETNFSSVTTTMDEKGNPLSLTNFLYLTMVRISFGGFWKDEQDGYFFYRLLFCSWSEAQWLFVEKIEVSKFDDFTLISRFKIQEKDFNGNWWYDCEPKIEWISPTVVKLSFKTDNFEDRSEREFILDLTKLSNQ